MEKIKTLILNTLITGLLLSGCGTSNVVQQGPTTQPSSAPSAVVSDESSETVGTGELVGGWEVTHGSWLMQDNPDAEKAFKSVNQGKLAEDFVPIAVLGTQTVAGTNYSYLVRTADKNNTETDANIYQIIAVYQNLDGKSEVMGIHDLNYEINEINELTNGNVNVFINPNTEDASVDGDAFDAFDEAFDAWLQESASNNESTSLKLEPIAYIGKMGTVEGHQNATGTDYYFVVRMSYNSGMQSFSEIDMCSVHKPIKGEAKLNGNIMLALSADVNNEDISENNN